MQSSHFQAIAAFTVCLGIGSHLIRRLFDGAASDSIPSSGCLGGNFYRRLRDGVASCLEKERKSTVLNSLLNAVFRSFEENLHFFQERDKSRLCLKTSGIIGAQVEKSRESENFSDFLLFST